MKISIINCLKKNLFPYFNFLYQKFEAVNTHWAVFIQVHEKVLKQLGFQSENKNPSKVVPENVPRSTSSIENLNFQTLEEV